MGVPESVIDWTESLHAVVDELVAPIAAGHGARLHCKSGCNACCADALTVFEIEAAVIVRHHAELLASDAPGAEGACAFLDDAGACRIYAQRPYVCRTQGLPLRWLELDEGDDAPVEARDICPLNVDGGPTLEGLAAEECWTLGPIEGRLAARQSGVDGGEGRRVALRALFTTPPSSASRGAKRLPIVR